MDKKHNKKIKFLNMIFYIIYIFKFMLKDIHINQIFIFSKIDFIS